MTGFYDAYHDDPSAIPEGHAPAEIYARAPVVDADGKRLTWLCRLTGAQYWHRMQAGDITTWATTSKVKRKIKDKDGKDKDIPHVVFGDVLWSPGSPPIRPDNSVQAGDNVPEPELVEPEGQP